MFARIADRYDLGNNVLSFGMHRLWKRRLVRYCRPQPAVRWLDCATGTGDVAFLAAKAIAAPQNVTGIDFCAPMIAKAKDRAARLQLPVTFEEADVLQLPFPNASFDRVTIAFGIRNVDDPEAALIEMARVTKPGGIVGILEFGQPVGILRLPYHFYSRRILPLVGGILSGDRRAYEYLHRSSWEFPSGNAFAAMMERSGAFAVVEFCPIFSGIAYLYRGIVKGQAE